MKDVQINADRLGITHAQYVAVYQAAEASGHSSGTVDPHSLDVVPTHNSVPAPVINLAHWTEGDASSAIIEY